MCVRCLKPTRQLTVFEQALWKLLLESIKGRQERSRVQNRMRQDMTAINMHHPRGLPGLRAWCLALSFITAKLPRIHRTVACMQSLDACITFHNSSQASLASSRSRCP